MSDDNIEILGQKLSYPKTWHGMMAVLFVCITFFAIAYLVKGWATPEILRGLKGLNATSEEQEKINTKIIGQLDTLTKRITSVETNAITISNNSESTTTGSKDKPDKSKIQYNSLLQFLELSKLKEDVNNQSLSRLENVALIVEPASLVNQKIERHQEISQQVRVQQKQIQQQQQQIQQEWQ